MVIKNLMVQIVLGTSICTRGIQAMSSIIQVDLPDSFPPLNPL